MRKPPSKKIVKDESTARKATRPARKQQSADDTVKAFTFTGAGEVIAGHRTKRGWTLEQLAGVVRVNRSTLHRYEVNEIPISDLMVKRFAKAFQMKELDLMRDCLFHIRPKLKKSPFGKFIRQLASATGDE